MDCNKYSIDYKEVITISLDFVLMHALELSMVLVYLYYTQVLIRLIFINESDAIQ